MLLTFKTKNYKSFVEETVLSMTAAPKQKGLDYSLCKEKIAGKEVKGLCSSVIYGPNAAGKTNIIGAMDTFRAIVLRGSIRNAEEKSPSNPASAALELIPNNKLEKVQPVEFSVEFTEEGDQIEYSLVIDLGRFLDSDYERKIVKEELTVNEKKVFSRTDDLSIDYRVASLKSIALNSLDREELFLTNGFKLLFSRAFAEKIMNWFANKLMVVCRADSMQLIKRFIDPQKKTVYVEKTIDNAAKLFGINSNGLGYVINEDESEAKLCSLLKDEINQKSQAITAEIFESYGTIRFINLFPLIMRAVLTGATLIVDEFDASIHPMALMNIINIFHNDDINKKHAQLVFNTHNPIFLNSNLLRRDEIKFVERDDDSHLSMLYSLSDFGTTGDKGVRMHADYMKNYFISQYGAIKDIDFTPVFEELMASEGEVQ